MPTPEEIKELARQFNEKAFNARDIEYVKEVLSDDFVEHQELPGVPNTKEGALQFFQHMFTAIPDLHSELTHVVVSGDRVAVRSKFTGTDEGGFMPGMPPTGKTFELTSIDIVRVNDDGKFAEHWGQMDVMGAMQQLGLAPGPS